jgi:hypothetical protein
VDRSCCRIGRCYTAAEHFHVADARSTHNSSCSDAAPLQFSGIGARRRTCLPAEKQSHPSSNPRDTRTYFDDEFLLRVAMRRSFASGRRTRRRSTVARRSSCRRSAINGTTSQTSQFVPFLSVKRRNVTVPLSIVMREPRFHSAGQMPWIENRRTNWCSVCLIW